ncbi:unnamed protein product [Porites evermanni]|uniref:Uncharacterized protein n=1 Tax=Porites evermanni TaxID=104178 RepID=A0ABN8R388_9CNID|nr:unnamed protein product [Porites evermanni]
MCCRCVKANCIMNEKMADYGIKDAEEKGCNYSDEEFEITLKITPVLKFASGPAQGLQFDFNKNLLELHCMQRPINVELVTQTNKLQRNVENGEIRKAEKSEVKTQKGKVKNTKFDESLESKTTAEKFVMLPAESSPKSRRSLLRTLSNPDAAVKELSPRPGRRLSDPAVPCEKSLAKSSFDAQSSLRKLRPYLKRKAASRIQLLGKVSSSTGYKRNEGGNKGRLAKRMYPSLSKAFEQLAHIERRGSDPSDRFSQDLSSSVRNTVNNYEVAINDYSNQIHGLAVNLEKLDASNNAEFEENSEDSRKAYRRQRPKDENNCVENCFKAEDIHLQEILEEVLRSHLLTMEDYSPPSCDRASRSICNIVTRLLGGAVNGTHDGQRKLACVVYIGAVRDEGIQMAAQALWCPEEDTFAAASFRNESVCGMAAMIATPT